MTWIKPILCLLAAVAVFGSIAIFGPMFSRSYINDEKSKIDKHGKVIRGLIRGKYKHKGRQLYFVYSYHDTSYSNYEEYINYKKADYKFLDALVVNDPVDIMVDTLSPGNSYVILK